MRIFKLTCILCLLYSIYIIQEQRKYSVSSYKELSEILKKQKNVFWAKFSKYLEEGLPKKNIQQIVNDVVKKI